MTMTIEQIGEMMADFVQIGYMTAVRAYEPTSDELRIKDVEKWCRATFTDYEKLCRLIKAGVVTPHRRGESKNSPLLYSKAEIKQAIINARLSQYIVDDKVERTINEKEYSVL